jgi:hypothetical protein
MTLPISRGLRRSGSLLLADISGYTGFLQGISDAHRALVIEADEPPVAYALVSSLLDAMLSAITPPFRLVKFEGDALFAVAESGDMRARGPAVLDCLRACYAAFRERLGHAGTEWTCRCNACALISGLDLKFVLHHGEYVVQGIAGHEELLGPDVNVVHRLLKNHAHEVVGDRPYALLTAAAMAALEVPAEAMLAATERYEDIPLIEVRILPLA